MTLLNKNLSIDLSSERLCVVVLMIASLLLIVESSRFDISGIVTTFELKPSFLRLGYVHR